MLKRKSIFSFGAAVKPGFLPGTQIMFTHLKLIKRNQNRPAKVLFITKFQWNISDIAEILKRGVIVNAEVKISLPVCTYWPHGLVRENCADTVHNPSSWSHVSINFTVQTYWGICPLGLIYNHRYTESKQMINMILSLLSLLVKGIWDW